MQRVSQLTPALQVLCSGSSGVTGVRSAPLGEKAKQRVLRQGWKMSVLHIFHVKGYKAELLLACPFPRHLILSGGLIHS